MGIEHGDTSTDSQLRTLITSLAAIDDPIIKDIIITHIRTSPNFPLVSGNLSLKEGSVNDVAALAQFFRSLQSEDFLTLCLDQDKEKDTLHLSMKFPTVTSFGKDNRYINSYCKLLFLSTYFTALHRQIRQLVNQIDHWMVRYFPIITSIPSNNKTRKKDRKNTTYALDGWMVRNAPFVCGIGSVCQHDTLFSKSTGIHQDDFTPNAVLQTLNRHFAFACVPRKDIEDLEKAIKKITPIQEFKFVVDALENCPPAGKDELIRLGTVLMQLVSVGRKVLDAYDLAVALQPLLPSASLVAIPDSGHVFTPGVTPINSQATKGTHIPKAPTVGDEVYDLFRAVEEQ